MGALLLIGVTASAVDSTTSWTTNSISHPSLLDSGRLRPPGRSRLAGNLAPAFGGERGGAGVAASGSLRRGIRWRRVGKLAGANVYNALGQLVEVARPVHSVPP